MTATLDLSLVHRLAGSFPNEGWQQLQSRTFFRDRGGKSVSDWTSLRHLKRQGGVYAILLPCAWFSPARILRLYAPHTHETRTIDFEFSLAPLGNDDHGVAYVGRTTNLADRWRGHFSRGQRKDGGQVKYGLFDCELHADIALALQALRDSARVIYTVLPGSANCANRDVLEMALCARFGPPFNIKSER